MTSTQHFIFCSSLKKAMRGNLGIFYPRRKRETYMSLKDVRLNEIVLSNVKRVEVKFIS